jgi:pimeloyl-ACP methyl ester carboxylesterase
VSSVHVRPISLDLDDGRRLQAYDTVPTEHSGGADDRLAVFWQHGTSNVGAPPEPLFEAADRLGLRWVSHDRPGYGGSSPNPGRTVASVAGDVRRIADALDIDRFAVMGHSGGGPCALACGALLPARVRAVVSMSGPAPYDVDGLDWFAGMAAAGVGSNSAAARGRAAREAYADTDDDYGFTAEDEAALGDRWSWVLDVVRAAAASGPGPVVDDDLAAVAPWGFDPERITVPVLLLHGGRDRVVPATHARWLADHCPAATLRLTPDDGHITLLDHATDALAWLREQDDRD